MGYRVLIDTDADRSLEKMDAGLRKRLLKALMRIELLDNPRARGHALTAALKGYWTYPLHEDWRAVCVIQDKTVTVLVLDIGHRSAIYR